MASCSCKWRPRRLPDALRPRDGGGLTSRVVPRGSGHARPQHGSAKRRERRALSSAPPPPRPPARSPPSACPVQRLVGRPSSSSARRTTSVPSPTSSCDFDLGSSPRRTSLSSQGSFMVVGVVVLSPVAPQHYLLRSVHVNSRSPRCRLEILLE